MCSALIIDESTARKVVKSLTSSKPELSVAYKLDAEIVRQLDYTVFLKAVYSLPEDVKSIIVYWCRVGNLVGVDCTCYMTPCGSVLIDLTTLRKSRTIVDVDRVINALQVKKLCLKIGNYVYMPAFFTFSDHVKLTSEEEHIMKCVDELLSISGDIAIPRLILLLPKVYSVYEHSTLMQLYAAAVADLTYYFFSTYMLHVEQLRYIPSIIPIVFDTPIDLVIVTERDIIAHKLVDIDKTAHKGFTAVSKYVEYGFDKVVLVHYTATLRELKSFKATVCQILNRQLLLDIGYVVMQGYEIDRLLILKVPTYNKSMEYFRHVSTSIRNVLRQYFLRR